MSLEVEVRRLVTRIVDERAGQTRDCVALASDHGGFQLKERIAEHLRSQNIEVFDCGCSSTASVDYPEFAHMAAKKVARGECQAAIIVDGAGIGSAMAANKVPGIRAALCYNLAMAQNSREHNHANVLTLGAGMVGATLALEIVDAWLQTPWGEGRHARRVGQISEIESRYLRAEKSS